MSARSKTVFFALLAVLTAGCLHGISIESVRQKNYSESQLTTLSEYLGGKEHYGRRTYLRTDWSRKPGLYIIADLDEKLSTLPLDTIVLLDIVRGSDGHYKSFSFPLSEAKGRMGKALYLGITNPEDAKEKLLAWKLSFLDSNGALVAEKHSFLWAMPSEK